MGTKALRDDGIENCHMAKQGYQHNNINAISLLLALGGFAPGSELVLLRLESNMPSVSSARALTNVSQGLCKLTSPFPFGGYTDSPKQLRAL
jgi:hypothetical protein